MIRADNELQGRTDRLRLVRDPASLPRQWTVIVDRHDPVTMGPDGPDKRQRLDAIGRQRRGTEALGEGGSREKSAATEAGQLAGPGVGQTSAPAGDDSHIEHVLGKPRT